MKTVIPAQPGYTLLRVWPDFSHDLVPVIAFIVDSDSDSEPEPVTPIARPVDEPQHQALVFPDGRTTNFIGSIFADARNFIEACKRTKRTPPGEELA